MKRFSMLVATVAIAAAAHAQVPVAEYAARRTALAERVGDGVVVAFGGVEPVNYWPTFYQLPGFMYLTGLNETDAVLVMVKRGASVTSTIFVPTRTIAEARWIGTRTAPSEMQAKFGAAGRTITELAPYVDSLAAAGLKFRVVSDVQTSDYAEQDTTTRGNAFLSGLKTRHAGLTFAAVDSVVESLRAKKSTGEIAQLRMAVDISVKAHVEAMKAAAPGCGEFEIQALLDGTFTRMGGDRPGYGSIVGSGPNATILHYMENNRVMNDGELLLIDAATSYKHYSADITRTMPVNGKFTQAQKDVYQIVRDAQEAFVQQIKTGAPAGRADSAGMDVIGKGLARLGLIESTTATYDPAPGGRCPRVGCLQQFLYAWHGYGGHGIGLEVHDPAQYYTSSFQPGDVFTVEPGLYVDPNFLNSRADTPKNRAFVANTKAAVEKYKGIGVRIEDDYALTDRGLEWLSKGAPREIGEIEALMASRSKPELPGGGSCGRIKS